MARPSSELQLQEGGNKEHEGWFEPDEEEWAEASGQDPPIPRIAGPFSDGRHEKHAEYARWPSAQGAATRHMSKSWPYPSTVVPAERWGHRGLVGRPIDGGGVQRPVDQRSTRGQGEARGFDNISLQNSRLCLDALLSIFF